jgi:hypothetical protein
VKCSWLEILLEGSSNFCGLFELAQQILPLLFSKMPTNLISISVGQCGIGLGMEWWKSMCQEHAIGPDGTTTAQEIRGADNKDVFFYQVGLRLESNNLYPNFSGR